jgi:hypothetical protein
VFGRTAVVERITSRAYSVMGQMDRVLERRGRVGRLSPGLWRSCVMSVSSEPDPEGRQGSVGVAVVEPESRGIDRSCSAEHADGHVARGRHDLRGSAARWKVRLVAAQTTVVRGIAAAPPAARIGCVT